MNKCNYEFMCELGLSVVNGVLVDQDTNEMIKNNYTGKYIIDYVEGTYANWKYYENYDILNNYKQLKFLSEYYINKIAVDEGRYFPIITMDTVDDKMAIILISEEERVSSRYFPKENCYLAYIDIVYVLNENYNADLSIYYKTPVE